MAKEPAKPSGQAHHCCGHWRGRARRQRAVEAVARGCAGRHRGSAQGRRHESEGNQPAHDRGGTEGTQWNTPLNSCAVYATAM
jgi:hypothetical protein